MSSMTNTIQVDNITKRYGQHLAVDQFSFEVWRGEIFSMLGPNGAGKTSTIRMILDMIKNMLFKLKSQGSTIVMSIHEMRQVEEMADRLVMIDHGKRVLYGSVDEVRQHYAENAVIVSGQGDWARLPGVHSVKADETGR